MTDTLITSEQLKLQHQMLGLLIERDKGYYNRDNPTAKEAELGLPIERAILNPLNIKDISDRLGIDFDLSSVLLHNLKSQAYIGFLWQTDSFTIQDAGQAAYNDIRLLRHAKKQDEDAKKEWWDNFKTSLTLVVTSLGLIVSIISLYFTQVIPLEKDLNKLTSIVKELKSELNTLKTQSKTKINNEVTTRGTR
jgi:hypothetical protein